MLNGCVSTQGESEYQVSNSYLNVDKPKAVIENAEVVETKETINNELSKELRFIPPYKLNSINVSTAKDTLAQFDTKETLKFTADQLPLKDFIHQIFGEKLNLSYISSDDVNSDSQPVTLNLQDEISERKLFTVSEELLRERGYVIRVNDNIFYIHKEQQAAKGDVVYGYGNKPEDVPNTSLNIIQLVPFEYGLQLSLPNTLRVFLGLQATLDRERAVISIQGKRQDILKALDLISLLDRPSLYEKEIAAFKSNYIPVEELSEKLSQLLAEEGISLSLNSKGKTALSAVALENQGVLIFFSNNVELINRAVFWAEQVDKPIQTTELQYFIYQPQYSRAADLGESLEALIGSSTGRTNSTSVANENQASSNRIGARSASSDGLKMVIDERANSLIFHTSGKQYQQLIPLIKQLDILPKQVMLEVIIAEVTLTDEFKKGVEFSLNNGNYGLSTSGAFMGDGFGGLSYLLKGDNGQIAANLLKTNSLVNILSRPSLVVRDGVGANITVGTDIPIVGETTSDPINGDRQTTQIEYRKTGVQLNVTPTVNAQGVVLMEIDQTISNEVEAGSTQSVNPSVFERSIKTEVVAESGQTIILGGLISDNRTRKNSKVPLLGDIPILGHLFRADTESGDKTELVVLVTPKVIHNNSEWQKLKGMFEQNLTNLKF